MYYGKKIYRKSFAPYDISGGWYKGNTHTHSERSDGHIDPQIVAEAYHRSGYDFICISDHHIYTNFPKDFNSDILIIPGIELSYDVKKNGKKQNYHIGAIFCGMGQALPHDYIEKYSFISDNVSDAKNEISKINKMYSEKGNFIILNHPNWSRLFCEDVYDINGFDAIEIYNNVCELDSKTGDSADIWDYCLRRGRRMYGIAADDTHFMHGHHPRAYIMVKAQNKSIESIMSAVKSGSFYSSTGPEIYDFRLENRVVSIKCSPVKKIRIIKYEPSGRYFEAPSGSYLTEASTGIKGIEKYVRIEIIDENGFKAWTNPIFLHEEEK